MGQFTRRMKLFIVIIIYIITGEILKVINYQPMHNLFSFDKWMLSTDFVYKPISNNTIKI